MFNKDRKRILYLLTGLIVLSLSLIFYLSYYVIVKAEDVKKHPANRRSSIMESEIQRGSIYDRNGELLTYSTGEPGNFERVNNFPILYSHIIGYSDDSLGKSGLEASYNDYLLNRNGNQTLKQISDILREDRKVGNNLILSIDTRVQSKARELLEENTEKGSIILMSPKTGQIYAMASLPDFNVSTVAEDWDSIQESSDGVLLNRTINGRYPPGSTFKTVTSAAILKDKNIDLDYYDEGAQIINGREFNNAGASKGVGEVGIKYAFANSLNTYYVSKAIDVGVSALGNTAEDFMFNKKIPFDLPVTNSVFDFSSKMDDTQLAASAIGQGEVLATPLNMAMIASAVGNHGAMQKPILVQEVEDNKGMTIWKNEPEVLNQSISEEIAEEIKDLMVAVVREGNGANASLRNYQVAGKTGTAENSTGKSHAWFIGFAPADDPDFAIAVLLEEADAPGGKVAAPVARDLLLYAINNIEVEEAEVTEENSEEG